jgi:hypothetical protein
MIFALIAALMPFYSLLRTRARGAGGSSRAWGPAATKPAGAG